MTAAALCTTRTYGGHEDNRRARRAALAGIPPGCPLGSERNGIVDLVVRHRDVEAVAELLERIRRHLLRLVRDHLAFAGLAHAEALTVLARITVGWSLCFTAAA